MICKYHNHTPQTNARYREEYPHNNHKKEEGKDQESIQSSSTPDRGHHMGKR